MLTVATVNVNGIRAAARRGMGRWLADRAPDVLCLQEVRADDAVLCALLEEAGKSRKPKKGAGRHDGLASVPAEDLTDLIQQLTDQMHAAAGELQFELAGRLRDEIGDLKKELRQMQSAGHA